jgi:cysteinyl-tRNA synthetase
MAELEILQNDREIERVEDGVILNVYQKQRYPQKNINNLITKYKNNLKSNTDFIEKFEVYKEKICETSKELFEKVRKENINFINRMKNVDEFRNKAKELLNEEIQKKQEFIDKFDSIIKDTEKRALEMAEVEKDDALKKIEDAKAVLELWEEFEVVEEIEAA